MRFCFGCFGTFVDDFERQCWRRKPYQGLMLGDSHIQLIRLLMAVPEQGARNLKVCKLKLKYPEDWTLVKLAVS